jgi:hypothetical protein
VKEIHLVPEHHEDDWHTTLDCWCRPSWFTVRTALFQTERVVFHQEAVAEKGDPE